MECPRGSEMTESTHEVKTIKKALEWCGHVTELHLPISVNQRIAIGGRAMIQIRDKNGNLLTSRG